MPPKQSPGDLVGVEWITQRYDVVPATVANWIKRGGFPKPIMLNRRQRRWHISEILAWENKRPLSKMEAAE